MHLVLVFDTESRTDPTQRLTFGCWRVVVGGETVDEGLFHGDDLPEADLEILRAYASSHQADTAEPEPLRILSRRDFLKQVLWKVAYKERGPVVGLNLPFDWGRISADWGEARGSYYGGGFSLMLWEYQRQGQWQENKYRPRFNVKSIDSKRSLMGFGRRLKPDDVDLIPEGSIDGTPDPGYVFPGYPLDLRTLAFPRSTTAKPIRIKSNRSISRSPRTSPASVIPRVWIRYSSGSSPPMSLIHECGSVCRGSIAIQENAIASARQPIRAGGSGASADVPGRAGGLPLASGGQERWT